MRFTPTSCEDFSYQPEDGPSADEPVRPPVSGTRRCRHGKSLSYWGFSERNPERVQGTKPEKLELAAGDNGPLTFSCPSGSTLKPEATALTGAALDENCGNEVLFSATGLNEFSRASNRAGQ